MTKAARLNKIREMREDAGLSQQELADRIGLNWSKTRVSKLELGQVKLTVDDLRLIANALQCAPWQLLDQDGLSRAEVELIEKRRGLSEDKREIFDHLIDAVDRKKRA